MQDEKPDIVVRQVPRGQAGRSQASVASTVKSRPPKMGVHNPKPKKAQQGPAKTDSIPRLFEGEKAFVMATGPSFNEETVERIYAVDGFRYVGISDCYRICPFVDFFYACDDRWWTHHYQKVMDWDGSKNGYWCTEVRTKKKHDNLNLITGRSGKGLSEKQNLIHYGSNSGYQIMNCASLLGIKTMILIGYNMQIVDKQAHFFGDHPQGMSRNNSYHSFASQFKSIDYKKMGVTIINTAQPTKLDAFPKMPLDDAIEWAQEND